MMRSQFHYYSIVLFPLAAFFINCSGADLETVETKWPDGSIREKWTSVSDEEEIKIRQGAYQSWYENGQLYEQGEYLDNRRDGLWTRWHGTDPNVKIMEGTYVNGEMDGRWHYWMDPRHMNPSDSIDSMSHSSHHSNDGNETSWNHPESHKFAEFRDGKPHGISLSYHHNGQVADSFAYVNGKLEGKYVSYYDNGQAATIIEYRDGVRQGIQIIWDEQGNIISEIN